MKLPSLPTGCGEQESPWETLQQGLHPAEGLHPVEGLHPTAQTKVSRTGKGPG